MTFSQAQATAPAVGSAPRSQAVSAASRASMLITGRGSATTPRRLRLVRLVLTAMSGLLIVGGVATSTVLADRQAQAEVHATQFMRAGVIEADLLQAHAATATSLLLSGQQATSQQERARDATDDAASTLVALSSAGVDDIGTLSAISQGVLRYTEVLSRAQQQRGTEAFRATLGQAYSQLNDDLLPQVRSLQETHRAVSTSGVPWWMWLLPVLAWLTAAGVLAASWYAARTSHRVVNAGLALALVASAALGVLSGNVLTEAAAGGIGDQFARLSSLASARQSTLAADALLTNAVAVHSWKPADADALTGLLDEATQVLGSSPDGDLQDAAGELQELAKPAVDAAGKADWTAAARAVMGSAETTLSGGVSTLLDQIQPRVESALAAVHTGVQAQARQIVVFGVVGVLCALGAGLAAIAGLHQRLKEYR